ncbi:MAG: T9SS type A sorting domain-containing protein [Salibacteraceae bacterium]
MNNSTAINGIECLNNQCLVFGSRELAILYNEGDSIDYRSAPTVHQYQKMYQAQMLPSGLIFMHFRMWSPFHQVLYYVSSDTGQSWIKLVDASTLFHQDTLFPNVFTMMSDSAGIAAISVGKLMSTQTQFDSRDTILLDSGKNEIYYCSALNSDSCVCIGGGKIYFSENIGLNWEELVIPDLNNPQRIAVLDNQRWAIYREHKFSITHDGGESWLTQHNQTLSFDESKKYHLLNDSTIFGLLPSYNNSYSAVVRSLDSAKTWDITYIPYPIYAQDMEFINDSIAIIGSYEGLMVRMNRYQLPPPPPDTTEDTTTVIHDVSIRGHDVLIYPNPATNTQQVELNLLESSEVSHKLRSIDGSLIRNRDMGTLKAGKHTLSIELYDMPQGMYFHDIIIGEERIMKRFLHY